MADAITEIPNLDAATMDELHAFAAATRGVQPRTIAKRLGIRPRDVQTLHHYAWNKITAISCRRRGEIDTALMHEGICDRLYRDLPDNARAW